MDNSANLVKTCLVTRIAHDGREQIEDIILQEDRWELFCDGKSISTHNCLPLGLKQMAVGQLRYKGLIQSAAEIADIDVNEARKKIEIRLKTDTAQGQVLKEEALAKFSAGDIHRLQNDFEVRCGLFRRTGCAHNCALADTNGILFYFEDVARHNAMDKLLGEFLLQNMDAGGKVLFFSGRLALDILEKSIATGVKVLVSPGAPTLAAVEAAKAHDLTILGFVRPNNINIYANPQRISD